MATYLSFDGGGSKSCAILFDENGPLGYGRSGGTNTSSAPIEDVRGNIVACLDEALAGHPGVTLEAAYTVIVGPEDVLHEEIERRAPLRRCVRIGEARAGVLAGALVPNGLVAQAGTGSDAFYCGADGRRSVVGAAGPILGDDGGGAWIGQQAIRRGLAYEEGWGEPTSFFPLLLSRWGLGHKHDLIQRVYGSKTPFRLVASAVPVVAEAARAGDAMALSLFEEAGDLMAVQMIALLRREGLLDADEICVCCGGCWKAHPAMHQSFARTLRATAPSLRVVKPLFDPVMAGVVLSLIERAPGLSTEVMLALLAGPYDAHRIRW